MINVFNLSQTCHNSRSGRAYTVFSIGTWASRLPPTNPMLVTIFSEPSHLFFISQHFMIILVLGAIVRHQNKCKLFTIPTHLFDVFVPEGAIEHLDGRYRYFTGTFKIKF